MRGLAHFYPYHCTRQFHLKQYTAMIIITHITILFFIRLAMSHLMKNKTKNYSFTDFLTVPDISILARINAICCFILALSALRSSLSTRSAFT